METIRESDELLENSKRDKLSSMMLSQTAEPKNSRGKIMNLKQPNDEYEESK